MTRLEMTADETELVRGVLQGYLATLEVEIDHADRAEFKRMLKNRRYLIANVLERCAPDSGDDTPTARHESAPSD